MRSSHKKTRRRKTVGITRLAITVTSILCVAAVVAACGSSAESSDSSSKSTGSSSPVAKAVANYEAPVKEYQLPDTPLKNDERLKGKTIYYIPVSQAVPEFAITIANLQKAVAAVGANLQVCDGKAAPPATAACVQRAINNGASGIILDAIPPQFAENQIDTAIKKGIAVEVADQLPDPTFASKVANKDKITFVPGVSVIMQKAVSDWIIKDSGGKAKVLINEVTDGPSPIGFIREGALPQFRKYCPDCTMTINKVSTSNFSMVPSSTSAALTRHPDTNYVYSEFDQFLQVTQQGVQQAGYLNKVKGVSTTALLAGLQKLKNKDYLYADAGQDYPYTAYAEADVIYRMILGQPVPAEHIPMRLFTRQNVGSLQLSQEAQNNGSWFGPTNFPTKFEKLWGVS